MAKGIRAVRTISDRAVLKWGAIGAAAALPLSFLHPVFALGSGILSGYFSYYAFDALSRALFSKQFHPPARIPLPEWDDHRKWSDWLLLVPYVALFVYLLFAFGEVSDCLAGQDFWKSGWALCKG